jgi:hypothetical protein
MAARARALDRLLEPDRDPSPSPSVPEAVDPSRCGYAEPERPAGRGYDGTSLLAGAARRRARQLLAAQLPVALLERHILAELRASGDALALGRRAEQKRRALAETRLTRPVPTDHLIAWHFQRLGAPVPADLEAYARALDLPGPDAFHRSLLDEYLFATATAAGRAAAPSVSWPE